MKAFTIVAIDGAAASGKTTTVRILADKYGFMRVSTGEHYRAITYKLLAMSVNSRNELAVGHALESIDLGSKIVGSRCILILSGEEIEDKLLRSAEINESVSKFAHIPCVRKFLFDYQRNLAAIAKEHGFYGLAIEGRDVTSVIFPDADLRFFLYADANKRELRRDTEIDPITDRDLADQCVTLWQDGVVRIDTGTFGVQSVINLISRHIEEL
ncbi:MAG: (d)CMP kinase [Puniceicoccales bacterium]|jgi:cytidylate kinase|nr:(d)CMP kinase [Puniceicoccales bacterium]